MTELMAYVKGRSLPVSTNFRSHEFDCPCKDKNCTLTLIAVDLVNRLERIRSQVGPIAINSGFRCSFHNAVEGGKPHSLHLYGFAADVRPLEASMELFTEKAEEEWMHSGGLGTYPNRLHLDVRPVLARWSEGHDEPPVQHEEPRPGKV